MEELTGKTSIVEIPTPKGITPKQELACHMLAIGMKQIEVAKQCDCSVSTIRHYGQREDLQFLIKQIQWRIFGKDPKLRFDNLLHSAIDVLQEIMSDKTLKPTARIQAAKEVLDRSLGRSEQKHTHSVGGMQELFDKLDEMDENKNAIPAQLVENAIESVDYTEIAEAAENEVKNNTPETSNDYDL